MAVPIPTATRVNLFFRTIIPSTNNRPPSYTPKTSPPSHTFARCCRNRGCSALYEAGGDDGPAHGADDEKSLEQRELRGVHPARDGLVAGKPYSRISLRTARRLTPISSTTRRVRHYCTGLARSISSRTALMLIRSLSC